MRTDPIIDARIFVVDDEEANVRLLEQVLRRAGFHNVRSFSEGGSLLAGLGDDEPDLVLLDLHLPEPDGFAILESIRDRVTRPDYLPVLVLTADSERRARTRALASGASDFLLKPFDAEEVVLRARNLIESRLLHRAIDARNRELVAEVAAISRDLHDNELQWAEVADSLGRLETLATLEATANAICHTLLKLPDLAMVSILGAAADGPPVPLAFRARLPATLDVHRPVPESWWREIKTRIERGAWLGSWPGPGGRASANGLLGADVSAAAFIPVRSGGQQVGVLIAAAAGAQAVPGLARRLTFLEAFAALAGVLLGPGLEERLEGGLRRARISAIIEGDQFRPVFQPIVTFDPIRTVGYEALTRFRDGARPERRFAEAAAVGLELDLELACLSAALEAARHGLGPDTWLSLNVSPAAVLEVDRLAGAISTATVPVVLEITEHAPITDYRAFRTAIATLGHAVRVAVDDAGAGFASLRHILELGPAFVKLDLGLIRAIERDPARQALVAGMVHFAGSTGTMLIAEGVETHAEREVLRALGVDLGQGYLFGRPEPLEARPVEAVSA